MSFSDDDFSPPNTDLHLQATRVAEVMLENGQWLVTAESCTGGGIAQACTALPGSSGWFEGGFVTYSNVAKQQMLGVPEALLRDHGAVSQPVVEAMARGALAHSRGTVSVAVSGIAGPAGGSASKPVGTVWIGWATKGRVESRCHHFTGDRERIRCQAVAVALVGVRLLVAGEFSAHSGP